MIGSSFQSPIQHSLMHRPMMPVEVCPFGRAQLLQATIVVTLRVGDSKWLEFSGLSSLAFTDKEKALASSPLTSTSIYSIRHSNCPINALPRATHLSLSP